MIRLPDIAVIGMGCLLPGARNPDELWNVLIEGRDVTSDATETDFGIDPEFLYDSVPAKTDSICYRKNGYIRGFSFDPAGYRLSSENLLALDSMFHWSLYAARQALEDAGIEIGSHDLKRCGVAMGAVGGITFSSRRLFTDLYRRLGEPFVAEEIGDPRFKFLKQNFAGNLYSGFTTGYAPRIVSQALGAQGPRICFEAACASSLYAMRCAAYSLASGDADLMLAGAVCRPDSLTIACAFNMLHVFPENGHCLPFDRRSKGMKTGEGAGFFVLKRLSDAIRDGDRIHGVIEGIGLSNDGGRSHILTPHPDGQLLAYERAQPNREEPVDYVECHGTGTPLGDQIELDTLESFFAGTRLPKIGGNKCNVGHLLTAAGMVSLMKVIQSMKKGVIPPTIGIETPLESKNRRVTPEHFVTHATPWPESTRIKRAGINAFGFGGVNAHLILREPSTAKGKKPRPAKIPAMNSATPVIIGMGLRFGSMMNLDQFGSALRTGMAPWTNPSREDRSEKGASANFPPGSFLEEAEFDCVQFRLPPNEVNVSLFHQLLMASVADQALRNAGFQPGDSPANVAVLIGQDLDFSAHRYAARFDLGWELHRAVKHSGRSMSEAEFQTLCDRLKEKICPSAGADAVAGGVANLVANRLSAVWHFNGPSFSVFSQENSVFKALELARFFLAIDEVDAVVVGGIDLPGGWERTLWEQEFHPPSRSSERFAFSRNADGWCPGEGAGAIVLTSEKFAKKRGLRAYATLRALAIEQSGLPDQLQIAPSASGIAAVSRQALAGAGLSPTDVGYLEAHAGGIAAEDSAELEGLAEVYARSAARPHCVLASAKSAAGHLFAASGIASVISVALALHDRFRPGTRWNGPRNPAVFDRGAFYVPDQSEPWPADRARVAAVNSFGADGSCVHAIFSEGFSGAETFNPAPPAKLARRFPKVLRVGPKRIGSGRLRESDAEPAAAAPIEMATGSPWEIHRRKHRELAAKAHENTLKAQGLYIAAFGRSLSAPFQLSPTVTAVKPAGSSVLWNYEQVLELTTGKLAGILGDAYAEADTFTVRMRPPSPPFLFISRVTRLTAKPRQLENCVIEWEYDIPLEPWYASHGVPSTLIFAESSHATILALLAIGDPLFLDPETRFRVLDAVSSYCAEPPGVGETFSAKATVTSFIKTGRALLFRYAYECFHKGVCFFKSQSRAGVFYHQDLDQTEQRSMEWPRATIDWSPIPLTRLSNKEVFDEADIQALQRGDFHACFGAGKTDERPNLLAPTKLLLLKRVRDIDLHGGRWNQGSIVGEWDVDPQHWIFAVHFQDDPLMPATLLIEACLQTALFFMYDLGFLRSFRDFKLAVVPDLPVKGKFRGAVRPEPGLLQFKLHLKRMESVPHHQLRFDAELILQKRVIGLIEDLALRLVPIS
jgi:acyl transferase domain-containing protein/3-hydroxymyristoyl/3-hydroxydecanoyl-(acyl carrier protein) dehydratase